MVACRLAATGVARVACRRITTGFAANTMTINFKIPKSLPFGQMVAVVGSEPLGGWDAQTMLRLDWSEGDLWTGSAEVPVG